MIEIVVPYWAGAAVLCILMIVCIALAIGFTYLGAANYASFAIVLLIVIDLFAVGVSFQYMNTPIDSPCCESCLSNWNDEPHCVYPTINPYEQQPIHPVMWGIKSFWWIADASKGAIVIKNEVI